MLTEWSTYEELKEAVKEGREYGHRGYNNPRIIREFRHGKKDFWYRTRTSKHKLPVLYNYEQGAKRNEFMGFHPQTFTHLTFVVLEGKHGDEPCESYAITCNDSRLPVVIRGHAIRRYLERSRFQGTLEETTYKVLKETAMFDIESDLTDGYVYYDGGVFICRYTEGVLIFNTFVMNRQLFPEQRMKSLKSEKEINGLMKKAGLI